jgi:hypothetical protein
MPANYTWLKEDMYYAYFDETGDSGFNNSPTGVFALSAILIHDRNWLASLDQVVAFRRYLRDQFHISTRAELKASWLVHNKGDIRKAGLTYPARMSAYMAAMRFQRKAGLFRVFTVLIKKNDIQNRNADVREICWRYAIQRLERFGTAEKDNIHIVPDEGHGEFIKKKIRSMRRFHYVPSAYGTESLDRKAENIIEDPSDRCSRESYFVQLADLNAYAAFRKVFPGPNFDASYWDELDSARIQEVNTLRGGPAGIVVWP